MSIKPDRWIREMCAKHGMIEPFEEKQVREGVISYGVSSYGYDIRIADEFKIFTNVNSTDRGSQEDGSRLDGGLQGPGRASSRPTRSRSAAPSSTSASRATCSRCASASRTYARCGIITNVTPFEPEWEGFVTLEISNTTPLPAKIYANEGIAQVLFFESDEPCEVSYKDKAGKYQEQQRHHAAEARERRLAAGCARRYPHAARRSRTPEEDDRMFKELGQGLGVTFENLFKKPFTVQYPEEKLQMFPRFRGLHILTRHEDGLERCVGCELCAVACPADAIFVEAAENDPEHPQSHGERYAKRYEINMLRCIFCGMCEEACPEDAIYLEKKYELSDYDRDAFIYTKDELMVTRRSRATCRPVEAAPRARSPAASAASPRAAPRPR